MLERTRPVIEPAFTEFEARYLLGLSEDEFLRKVHAGEIAAHRDLEDNIRVCREEVYHQLALHAELDEKAAWSK